MAIHKIKLTEEEVKKFNEENKLKPEELEAVNGGFIHFDKKINRYEVIDDETGQVLDDCWYYAKDCGDKAKRLGMSDIEITDEQLEQLRKFPGSFTIGKSHSDSQQLRV